MTFLPRRVPVASARHACCPWQLVVVLAAMLAGTLAAQQSSFQGGTRLIRLDVSVLDAKRQPVRDLTAADFTITERGKVLTVKTFDAVSVPTPGPGAISSSAGRPVPGPDAAAAQESPEARADSLRPGAAEEGLGTGRLVVLIMDYDMTPGNPKWAALGKDIARSVVERMGPNDRVAIQFTRVSSARLELTTDRDLLRTRIDTFSPGGFLALPPTITQEDEVPRYHRTMSALEYTVEAIGPLTDRQKLIVYVGPGIPVNQVNGGDEFVLLMNSLFKDAERANVAIYTFDTTGAEGLYDYAFDRFFLAARTRPSLGNRPPLSELMDNARSSARRVSQFTTDFAVAVAGNTGGRALIKSDNFGAAVEQLFTDTSYYYLLAVEPPSARPDGRFHEVSVKVNRPNTEVRARRGYYYTL